MENWKTIESFEAYEVSDLGRVRRVVNGGGSSGNKYKSGLVLKLRLGVGNYWDLGLYREGKMYRKKIHILVAKAFVPNPHNLPEVNHKGKKSDSRATMLEWRSAAGHGQDRAKREQLGDGVSFDKNNRNWVARYSPKPYTRKNIGSFSTKRAALAARRAAVKALPEV